MENWRDVLLWKTEGNTLLIKGDFIAISSGLKGGYGRVNWLFNHTVTDRRLEFPDRYISEVASNLGLDRYFGLLTAVPMEKLAIAEHEDVMVFLTAGVSNPNEKIGTINIIAVVDGNLRPETMINAVITVTEAKCHTLIEMGYNFTGTCTDAVIIAHTGRNNTYRYAGFRSRLGKKLWTCVKEALRDSLTK